MNSLEPLRDPAESLDSVGRLTRKCLRTLDIWMDMAAVAMKSPGKLTGSELNRTGELLMAAQQRLAAEERRLNAAVYAQKLRSTPQTRANVDPSTSLTHQKNG